MDFEPRQSQADRKKQKKKKHRHSRSQSKKDKKQKDREERHPSKQHKKKDKSKKKHRSKSKDKERQQRRDKEREDRSRERQIKPEKEKEKEKDKERQRDSEKYRQRDVQKQRQKQRQKDREREKQRQKGRDRKDRDRERERQRDRPTDRRKSKSRQRDVKDKYRDRSRQRSNKQRYDPNKDRRGKQFSRQDKYERWRKQARFRFDSPPKSNDSDNGSDDPENMDRLNKMKAEKQLVTSKADKKLYLGNLPPNITSNQLMQMLNSALKKMEINCEIEGDSIVTAWISPDGVGHYAFVQFRTAQQATAGLALNGASLYGYQLKLGRPKQYIEYHKQLLSQFGSDGNIDTILRKVQAMGGFQEPPTIEERLVSPPSKILVLKHIVTIEELAIDEQYGQIMQDVREMAKRHGDVIKIVIPRPREIDLEDVIKRVKGLGYIFIEYRTIQQARYARKQFIKQMFSERSVACSFFPEDRFREGDLDLIDKIVVDY